MITLFFSFRLRAVLMVASAVWLSILGGEAAAQSTRPYQMTTHPYTSPSSASVDIRMFSRGVFAEQPQPPTGRSIAWLHPDATPAQLDQYGLDWTRIAAVYVDEPYGVLVERNRRCDTAEVETRRLHLEGLASAVRARSPSTRFWVNFTETEADLIRDGCFFNQSYIDVISLDAYYVDFTPTVRDLYEFIYTHRPTDYQQIALVIPTFTGGTPGPNRSPQTAAQGVARLTQYLDYAASKNQTCHFPLGPTGVTGIYDGCPVWIVSGFLSGSTPPNDPALMPLDHPASVQVFNAWQAKFAVQRIDPTQVRRVRELTPLLFND